jgi:arylsulfatase A-like enzyme
MHDQLRIRLKLVVLFVSVISLCCSTENEQLNVLVIGIDTLRPDHLGCYGYGRPTSPAIDRLAADGVLFENTVSQSPWTLPSFATVFTSLYPSQHGAMTAVTSMRTSFPTLATILKERGYATGSVVNASVLRPEFGLDRGFDYYDPTPPEGRRADGTTKAVLAWIDKHKGEPFFMFAHYFDPHEPYAPPAPYDGLFYPEYDGRIGNTFVLHDHFPNVRGMNFEDLKSLEASDWDRVRALYDGEIAFTDKAVDSLLKGFEKRGLLDRTVIVFLSDHGEEFFEHQGFGHGHTLYNEVIRVPLIFSFPKRLPPGRRISQQVRLVDVMPTVLGLLDIDPGTPLEGSSLVPLLTGRSGIKPVEHALFPPGVAYSEGMLRGPERKGIVAHPWKLVYDFSDGSQMMFNLNEDEGEHRNLTGERPEAIILLESLMFRTLFATYDTWHIEMAGGSGGALFDADIRVGNEISIGKIHLYRLLDASGAIVDPMRQPSIDPTGSALKISGLRTRSPVTLTFTADAPPGLPVSFDLRIDGEVSPERIFVGGSLSNPEKIPVQLRRRRCTVPEPGGPPGRPDPPYILIWRTKPRYTGDTRIKLTDQTRRELKALGYIQ